MFCQRFVVRFLSNKCRAFGRLKFKQFRHEQNNELWNEYLCLYDNGASNAKNIWMDMTLPSPRCNLNNVILPEVLLRKMLLDVSYIIIFCTVEKCSSSLVTRAFRCPILSWRSLTTKLNRVPSREQNLLKPSDRL